MRVILLNGAPRAGKSTAARMLQAGNPDRVVIGFSYHLKRMVHGIYLGQKGWEMDPDAFDAVKSEPQALLSGMSWRQAYIHYSEKVIKPLHGEEWFGQKLVDAATESCCGTIIVPDSGFVREAERVVREVGAENVHLVRLYRQGCTFEGDSRSYVDLGHIGVPFHPVFNLSGDPEAMREELELAAGIV